MSKKLTKLSRSRPKTDSKPQSSKSNLNNSDEDFQSVIEKPSKTQISISDSSCISIFEKPQSTQIDIEVDEIEESTILPSNKTSFLPPCPFCGKTFNKDSTRISHLKSCGTQLGVNTNQLIEIKKLEQRQAEEWKALNLPKTVQTIKNASKSNNSTARA